MGFRSKPQPVDLNLPQGSPVARLVSDMQPGELSSYRPVEPSSIHFLAVDIQNCLTRGLPGYSHPVWFPFFPLIYTSLHPPTTKAVGFLGHAEVKGCVRATPAGGIYPRALSRMFKAPFRSALYRRPQL